MSEGELRDRIVLLQEETSSARESSAKLIADLQLEAKQLEASKEESEGAAAAEVSSLKEILSRLKNETDAVRSDAEQKIAELKSAIAKFESEKIAIEETSTREIASLSEQEEQLSRQMEDAQAEAADKIAAAQSRLSTLRAEIEDDTAAINEKVVVSTTEVERLERDKDALQKEAAAKILALKERVLLFAEDLLQAEKSVAEQTIAARNSARSVIVALSGDKVAQEELVADADLEQRVVALQQDADQLVAERRAFEQASGGELAALRAKVTSLAAEKVAVEKAFAHEQDALKTEAERLVSEKAESEKSAQEKLLVLKAEVARLAAEKEAAENSFVEQMSAAEADIRQLVAEKAELTSLQQHSLASLAQAAAVPVQASPKIVKHDSASIEENIETSPGTTKSSVGQKTAGQRMLSEELAGDSPTATIFSSSETDETDPFAFLQTEGALEFGSRTVHHRKSSEKPVVFTIDKSKTFLGTVQPDDVLEIYQSLNRTRVALEDNTTVTCDAYMCSVKENGKKHIYILLYLVDSKDILVYVPEKQPANDEEYAVIMGDGLDFIEIVGFMMDPIDMGRDAESRTKILDKVPVLRKIG